MCMTMESLPVTSNGTILFPIYFYYMFTLGIEKGTS